MPAMPTAVCRHVTSLACIAFATLLVSCGGGADVASSDTNGTSPKRPAAATAPPPSFFPSTTIPSDANTRGMWSPVYAWPGVSVHAVIAPDGRVLTFGSSLTGQQGAYSNYDFWDPSVAPDAGHLTLPNTSGTDIFCSSALPLVPESPGAATSIFIAGGDVWTGSQTTNTPNQNSNLIDVAGGTISRRNNLLRPRWYSTSTTLPTGEIYIQGGAGGEDRPEMRGLTGSFRLLSGADTSTLHYSFPRNFVAPDGRIFGYDTNGQMYFVNTTGIGAVSFAGQLANAYASDSGSAAMFRPGRILQLGGNSNGAVVIDIGNASPIVTPTQSLSSQRQWVNATILADGKVLATSGSQVRSELIGVNTKAEIWDPQSGQWMQGPSAVKPRLYHSNAILLPDASVLVTGGGATEPLLPGPADNLNSEIYYPPYFFSAGGQRASRPYIASAPDWMDIGSVLSVGVANATSVSRVTLVKTGASTHSFNMEQRFLELTFSANGLNLSVQAPTRAADAPPGFYMLFVFDQAGVPSIAKILRMGIASVSNPATMPTVTNPGAQSTDVGGTVSLAIAASDPNGDSLRFAASGLPAGLSIDPATGIISGVASAVGSFNVVVTVSDGVNNASTNFVWTINPINGVVIGTVSPVADAQSVSSVTFTASSTGGTNVRYRWNFGDGTGDTAWSASSSISHTFAQAGTFSVTVSVTDDSQVIRSRTFLQTVGLPLTATRPAASSNLVVEVPTTGGPGRLWVVNQDNDSVTAFDLGTRAKLAEVAVGSAPRALAVAPNGLIWVTNKRSDSISVIDPASRNVVNTIALPRASQPFGIAMSPVAQLAFVVLEGSGQLLKFDTGSYALRGTLAVGANPRHVSVNADGTQVYVSRFITPALPGESTATVTPTPSNGGEVLVVSAGGMSLLRTIVLQHSSRADLENQGRGLPNYLGAVTISPDGTQAWVPSKQDNVQRGALRDGLPLNFQNTVRAISSRIALATAQEDLSKRVDHDNASVASAATFDRRGVYLFVALETSREIAVVDAHGGYQVMRFDTGRAPQGLALSPDGNSLYVNNLMDRTIGVYDLQPLLTGGQLSVPLLTTLSSVGTEKLAANVLVGKQFFYDARDTRLARDRYLTCATCHNDGGSDGRTWDFTGQGEGLRNTVSLRGRAGGQGRMHWSGNFDEVQDFEAQIRTLAGGTGLMSDISFAAGTRSQPLGDPKAGVSGDLDALAAYVTSLSIFDRSPYRDNSGSLTAAGAAGRTVFMVQGCNACHGGAAFTNSDAIGLVDIGTIKPSSGQRLGASLTGIDIPTLRDVWQTGPYLHDGSAATLEQAVLAHNGVSITSGDLAALVQYLREIGAEETTAPGTQASGLAAALPLNESSGTSALDLSGNGHFGALLNGPTWVTGKSGNGLSFDGVDDALTLTSPGTLNFGSSFTLMMWVKRNALGGTGQRHLFSKCDVSSWVGGCKELYFAADQLRFGTFGVGDITSATIADQNWHHVALVFTRTTNAVQIYVDGTLRTSVTANLEADGANHVVTIGNMQGRNSFSGVIDEIRVYGQALSAAQVATDMNTPLAPVVDTTPPVLSGGSPAGTLVAGTTQATLSLTSNESATCRYATTGGIAYASMVSTFSTTGGSTHSTVVTGLAGGQSYQYYVRCQDGAGNANSVDFSISFAVAAPDSIPPTVSMVSPATGATVTGTVNVSASASDNIGVAGVQFLLDGVALGAEVTSAPFTVAWNSVGTTNGAHTLSARARDAAGNTTAASGVSVNVSNSGPAGLSAAFGFNEGSGTSSADLSGNGHTATLVGSPAWTVGMYGNSVSFNGGTPSISVAGPAALDFGGSFTLMMWAKRNVLGGTVQRHLFSKCSASGWASGCKELYFYGDQLRFGSYATGDINSVTIADQNWHHVALVFTRATNAVQVYVDGTLRTTATANLEADGVNHVVTIGNLQSANTFSGAIDEVRIYGQALTAAQVANDMNTPLAPVADTAPPVISGGSPSGSLPASTTQATLRVTTNENASCRYATGAGLAYASMPASFSSTGGTSHSTVVTGLSGGQNYSYYVRCQDGAGNANSSDFTIAFSVAAPDTTAPSVAVTTPSSGATVSGTLALTAIASDNVGVVGVQFLIDGASFGAELAAGPYTTSWNTTAVSNGIHSITARARDAAGNSSTSTAVSVTVSNPLPDLTAPTVALTAPVAGDSLSGSVTVTANAADNVGVAGVQFLLDGAALGAEVTAAPFSINWNTAASSNGSHTLAARARDAAGNVTTSAGVAVTVANADTAAPTVSVTAPAPGTNLSGVVNVTATASDTVGVAGVQFLLDGVDLGAEDTVAPYAVSWNSATATDGSHVLTARARDAAGNTALSSTVVVTVANSTPAGLVAAFGFSEGSGTISADLSGAGHGSTLLNGTAWAAGKFGSALSFDGVNDSVSVASPSTLEFGTGSFTIMMWAKRGAVGGSAQRHLFSKCSATTWTTGCKEFYFAGNVLRFGSYTTGDVNAGSISDTNWHHVAVVFTRGTNAVQVYVDGSLRTTATRNLEADGAGHVVTIGNMQGSNTFLGLLDEVRVYNRPLTAGQVSAVMNAPL